MTTNNNNEVEPLIYIWRENSPNKEPFYFIQVTNNKTLSILYNNILTNNPVMISNSIYHDSQNIPYTIIRSIHIQYSREKLLCES